MTFSSLHSDSGKTPELLIFGDLTASFVSDLRGLLHCQENATLQSFFEMVASCLRKEIGQHPSAIQDIFPNFTTIIDLVARFEKAEGAPVLKFFLMTVCQVAKFI